jgi:AcrR family transcriptional regulator
MSPATDPMQAFPASPRLPAREDQARERRRQLVAIAKALIEEEGPDAVTLPRVTERAGCARTLAYRYFASREALLAAVVGDYFERLDARLPEAEQRATTLAVLRANARGEPGPARELVELFWDVQVGAGLGGAILYTNPLPSPQLRELLAQEPCAAYERRFLEPMVEAGLSPAEARAALDSMTASFVHLIIRERSGELSRDAAIDLHVRLTTGLMRGLFESSTTAAQSSST